MIYCPGHNGVFENDIADSLTKTEAKKARHLHLSFTTRNGASKIVRLKSSYCLLNYHKSKFDTETKPNCQECNSKKTPIHLFDCNKFENERQKLKKAMGIILNKK